jgi:hypothetical protein
MGMYVLDIVLVEVNMILFCNIFITVAAVFMGTYVFVDLFSGFDDPPNY